MTAEGENWLLVACVGSEQHEEGSVLDQSVTSSGYSEAAPYGRENSLIEIWVRKPSVTDQ